MPEPLSPAALDSALASLHGWSGGSGGLLRTWRFPSFSAAMTYMQACTPGIDALNHHPEWSNVYDTVSVRLTTHDAGNRVTARDIDLAILLDGTAALHGGR